MSLFFYREKFLLERFDTDFHQFALNIFLLNSFTLLLTMDFECVFNKHSFELNGIHVYDIYARMCSTCCDDGESSLFCIYVIYML